MKHDLWKIHCKTKVYDHWHGISYKTGKRRACSVISGGGEERELSGSSVTVRFADDGAQLYHSVSLGRGVLCELVANCDLIWTERKEVYRNKEGERLLYLLHSSSAESLMMIVAGVLMTVIGRVPLS